MVTIPEPVARIGELMSTFSGEWCFAGGWAVDAWLGQKTREHGDIDVVVFHEDQRALFDHLEPTWHLIAHDPNVPGATTEPWNGRHVDLPAHIHCRPKAGDREELDRWIRKLEQPRDDWNLEVMINERAGREWVVNDEPHISLPIERCWQVSPWGFPTALPELLMFYKATAYIGMEGMKPRKRDQADVRALLPTLNSKQRKWLSEAVSLLPRHDWVAELNL